MKKFHLIFLVSVLIIFIACGSDKKTGERLPQSEITDEDIVNVEHETTDEEIDDTESDDDTIERDNDTDTVPSKENDTESDDIDAQPTDPCEPNPCLDVTNSTGVCIVLGENFSCKCDLGYSWNGYICKSNPNGNFLSIGNLCTGIDKCYNYGEVIDCPDKDDDFYGQDAQYAEQGICILQSFSVQTVSGNSIVVDNNTGLIWLQEPLANKYTWEEAGNECLALNNSNYAGYSDWHLPSPTELLTIITKDWLNSVFKMQHKVNISDPSYTEILWTSKEYDSECAYYFGPFEGWVWNGLPKTNAYEVLCVRGDGFSEGSFQETTENGKNVVIDSTTGLMWQKEYVGDGISWGEALSYCQGLNDENYANHNDWRLPNKNELISLLNYNKSEEPYSDFPDMPGEYAMFWSSTTCLPEYDDMAWGVIFGYGIVSRNYKYNKTEMYVRCVR